MTTLKKYMLNEETHKNSNCFCLTVIAHGDAHGFLFDANKRKALHIELFIGDLSDVKTLRGRPKILVF